MKQSHIIHTVALCLWGFAGSCVLCKNCFASFVAQSMTFVMSSPLQSLLSFRDRWLISSRFLLIQSRLVFLHLAACSSVSFCRFLVFRSSIVFLRLAPCSSDLVISSCFLLIQSCLVFLRLAACSSVSFCQFLVFRSSIVFLHLAPC
jgi:hypothetical protein